jgi:outer membrane protein assembly factor BamB
MVFVGDEHGNVLALSESDGSLQWSYATHSSITSRAAVANGVVYAGSSSQNLYAIDETSGVGLITPLHVGPSPTEITVANGAVYVGSDDHVIRKFGL